MSVRMVRFISSAACRLSPEWLAALKDFQLNKLQRVAGREPRDFKSSLISRHSRNPSMIRRFCGIFPNRQQFCAEALRVARTDAVAGGKTV